MDRNVSALPHHKRKSGKIHRQNRPLAIGIGLFFSVSITSPAFADMGLVVIVPAIGGVVWQVLLGVIIAVPRWMAGNRGAALGLYAALVLFAWVVNLKIPADSYIDFWPIFLIPLTVSIALLLYVRFRIAA